MLSKSCFEILYKFFPDEELWVIVSEQEGDKNAMSPQHIINLPLHQLYIKLSHNKLGGGNPKTTRICGVKHKIGYRERLTP